MSLLPVGFGSAADDDYEITGSLRLRSSADAHLSRTNAANGNRKTFTFSGWVKYSGFLSHGDIWSSNHSSGGGDALSFRSTNKLNVALSGVNNIITTAVFRDPSAWYHIVFVLDTTQSTASNRIKLYVNGGQITAFDTVTYPSLNADAANFNTTNPQLLGKGYSLTLDGYLTEVNFIDGQALAPTDFGEYDANGTWKPKRYTGTYGTNGFYLPMKPTTQADGFNTVLFSGDGTGSSISGIGFTPDFIWAKNRTNAYNHELWDTVRGTASDLASNSTAAEITDGNRLTSFDSDGFSYGTGSNLYVNSTDSVAWAWDAGDNQPSTGHSSVLYAGSGAAQSIKGFGFSPDLIIFKNRASASPLLIDSVRGAHQELQPNSTGAETSNSGTRIASIDADGFSLANTAVGGLNASNNKYVAWGWDAGDGDPVSNTTGSINSTVKANDAIGFSIVSWEGSSATATVGHGLSTAPKVIIAKNRDASTEWPVYHDSVNSGGGSYLRLDTTSANTSSSIIWTGSPTSSVINVGSYSYVNSNSMIAYCFSEVSGVSKFGSYTGTGATGKVITTGFRPGFVMIKSTSITNSWHIYDGSRNPFNPVTLRLHTNSSAAEDALRPLGDFTDTGFTINSTQSQLNQNGATYIYMAFKGSYSDHVSPLNDTGSIDSRVKANTSKGFSIVSYEGTGGATDTIGHGLSSTPEMVMVKDRDSSNFWAVYHVGVDATAPEDYLMRLNTTDARLNGSVYWNDTAPTSSVFTVGTSSALNAANSYIAYCFHSVTGYSKFGSYQNNNSTNGVTVTTGFRPGFIMLKCTDAGERWFILDNARQVNNVSPPSTAWLVPNDTAAEGANGATTATIDFLDNGFQIKTTNPSTGEVSFGTRTYIYMAFADTADARFNFDASGNKNNFDANNINSNSESESTYDQMKDTPSLVDENAGNFATLNPLDIYPGRQFAVDGNLKWNDTSGGSWGRSNISVTSGKWYWEVSGFSTTNWMIGVSDGTKSITNYYAYYSGAPTALVYLVNGNTYIAGANASFVSAFATTDVVGFGLDADAGSLAVYKNNVLQGTITGLSYGSYSPMVAPPAAGNCVYNFGQRPLAYTPPTGFLKLNTFNLPDSTIEDGSDYFNTVLYSGNSSTQSITGVGFQPDLVWAKDRTNVVHHTWTDAVRGVHLDLFSSSTNPESNDTNGLTAFNADGYSLGSSTNHNVTGHTYVGWNWLAGNSTSTNTAGDVNSTVSVNTTAGFSIATATTVSSYGSFPFTIGHGLGTAPAMVIYKSRTSSGQNWWVWHKDLPNAATGRGILLNSTSGEVNGGYFASNPATATTMGINAAALINDNVVMYSFAEVEGYSSFGSYTGNGNAEGPFVYTGFKPAFVVTKRNGSSGWPMHDDKRSPYNVTEATLYANAADAEVNPSTEDIDFLSNGFKMRGTTTARNSSGSTYIYIAFAENPFKNSNAR